MENQTNYVGNGWQTNYGINLSLNLEKLKQLPIDSYGNIKLSVSLLKQVNEKSKATHSVKENTYSK